MSRSVLELLIRQYVLSDVRVDLLFRWQLEITVQNGRADEMIIKAYLTTTTR